MEPATSLRTRAGRLSDIGIDLQAHQCRSVNQLQHHSRARQTNLVCGSCRPSSRPQRPTQIGRLVAWTGNKMHAAGVQPRQRGHCLAGRTPLTACHAQPSATKGAGLQHCALTPHLQERKLLLVSDCPDPPLHRKGLPNEGFATICIALQQSVQRLLACLTHSKSTIRDLSATHVWAASQKSMKQSAALLEGC